ncbi:hypothetical protein B0181_07100 [Moraxella caviae]|uniref:Uncharacterized protein n=1 Tax=Moraxella caviae TaxID=34060 RepID=A0A1T0A1A4_9GAMM|nr:hypothetical protein B0181_07100 [Moraxella caviae]
MSLTIFPVYCVICRNADGMAMSFALCFTFCTFRFVALGTSLCQTHLLDIRLYAKKSRQFTKLHQPILRTLI